MAQLGIKMQDLPKMKKTDARKQALAHWIKSQSTIDNAMLAQMLSMGHPANASTKLAKEGIQCYQTLISKD